MNHPLDLRIDPIPELEFFDGPHAYRYKGNWIPYSVTQVCKGNDSYFKDTLALPENDPKRIRLEKALHRGTTVHDALERWNRGESVPEHPFSDWTAPCVRDPFWDRWKCVPGGVELSLIDPRYRIAGRCDLIVQNQETGELALADYKTQSNRDSKPYNIRPQLGAYCNLCDQHSNTAKLSINKCFAIWVRPGNTVFQPLDGTECITEYLAARDLFFKSIPDF